MGEDSHTLCQYYKVMCIDREGDVAYKKGIRLVQKAAWDALDAETITFKLG